MTQNDTTRPREVGPVTRSAATGGGVAAAVVTVFAWIMAEVGGPEMPNGVETAVTIILVFIGSLIGGYLPRPVPDTDVGGGAGDQ